MRVNTPLSPPSTRSWQRRDPHTFSSRARLPRPLLYGGFSVTASGRGRWTSAVLPEPTERTCRLSPCLARTVGGRRPRPRLTGHALLPPNGNAPPSPSGHAYGQPLRPTSLPFVRAMCTKCSDCCQRRRRRRRTRRDSGSLVSDYYDDDGDGSDRASDAFSGHHFTYCCCCCRGFKCFIIIPRRGWGWYIFSPVGGSRISFDQGP